jgi:hypothetical protein
MLKDVVEVRALEQNRLFIRFQDGVSGEYDVTLNIPFLGVFAPLADPAYFRKAYVNHDIGTVCWPNGADIDPDELYASITANKDGRIPATTI